MEVMKNGAASNWRKLAAAVFAAISALMVLANTALAALTSAQQGYSTPGGAIQSQVGAKIQTAHEPVAHHAAAAVQHVSSGPQLPFTGLDLMAVLIVGLALLALGFGIRRVAVHSTAQ